MQNLTIENNLEFKELSSTLLKQFSNNSPIIYFIKNNRSLFKKNDALLFKNSPPNLFQLTSSFAFSAVIATLISTQHPFIIFSVLLPLSYTSSHFISKFYFHHTYSQQRFIVIKYLSMDNDIQKFLNVYKELLLSSLLMIVKNNDRDSNILNSSKHKQLNQTIIYTYHKWKNEGFSNSVLADIYLNIFNNKLQKNIIKILQDKNSSQLFAFSQSYKIFNINQLKIQA